ncbi:MAG: hypothetical protein V4550_15410 [Gemmatimonadota bacterium]
MTMPSAPAFLAARPVIRRAAIVVLLALAPSVLSAQLTLTHTEDAAPVPVGMLRVRAVTGWSRIDERFSATGRRSLDDEISTDSLGPRQLPLLTPIELGLKTLTNNPLTRLTLGRLGAVSGERIVVAPIAFEFGVTRRLSVGLLFPFIQTRRAVHITVNSDTLKRANMGYLPERLRSGAAQVNAQVYNAFIKAADSIATLLSRCPANPLATGCAAINANAADASAAQLQARRYADAVKSALGTDSASVLIAPRASSALATAIDAERAATNTRLQKYLGAGAGSSVGVFTSSSDFSYIDLQGRSPATGLLRSALGGGLDSIQTTNRPVLGGVSFGAQYLLMDRFQHDTLPPQGLQTRLAVGGMLRFESLRVDSATKLGTVSPSQGSGFELHSALDFISGNLGGTIAASFNKSQPRTLDASLIGDPEAFWVIPAFGKVTRTPGAIMSLDVTPRYLIGDWFAINGHYGLERTTATTYQLVEAGADCVPCNGLGAPFPSIGARTAQRVGFGIRYTTVEAYQRDQTGFPVEVSLSHLETISGDPGVSKVARDQIQVRLFFRVRGSK